MIISVPDIWHLAIPQHSLFLADVISSGLKGLGESEIDRQIRSFVMDNWSAIICGDRSQLAASIADYECRFGGSLMRSCVSSRLALIFDYEGFSKKSPKPWTAYTLCVQARYKVCSYCHMVATGTCLPGEEHKGYRPPIDHYYSKSEYPFLALTLTNFIPCCEKCNGAQMKGMVDFAKNRHLNPLFDDECIEFQLVPEAAAAANAAEAFALGLSKDKYQLSLVPVAGSLESVASIATFQLESRYESYAEQAYYLAKRLRGLSARLDMQRDLLEFKTSVDDNLEFEAAKYKSVPYGKARVCIAKQFGLLP